MDPISITVSCLGLVSSITSLSSKINTFVRTARDARSDLSRVSTELHSLKNILEILGDDASTNPTAFREQLSKQVSRIISNCSGVVKQIEISIDRHSGARLTSGLEWS